VKKTRKRSQLRLEQSTTIPGAMDGQEEEEEEVEVTPACEWRAAPRQQGRALI